MSNLPSTKILRGWRMGSLQKKIAKWQAQGYQLHGAVQYAPFGRKYLATMVLPQQPVVPPTPTAQQAP